MKKYYLIATIFVLSLTLGVTALAQAKSAKGGKKAACASCDKSCATPEQLKKFRADSLDLRRELMNKRFDLQREELQATPDSGKIAAIKADIETVTQKLDAMKTAAKLPAGACRCLDTCPLMDCGQCGQGKGKHGCCADCKECKDCTCGKDCSCASCAKAKKRSGKAAGCSNCNKKGSM